jgi:hypothetical protein
MKARVAGAWRDITSAQARIGGTWRTITSAKAYIGGAWRDVASFTAPLTASVSPSTVAGVGVPTGIGDTEVATTNSATCMPSGGVGPYTYAIARISGDGGTAVSSSSATSTFTRSIQSDEFKTSTFRWTVTDSLGSTATADVVANWSGSNF